LADQQADTIAAIATPAGRGGIGVVRISGPDTQEIGRQLLGSLPPPRRAMLRNFRSVDGAVIDNGIAVLFPGPNSFTGEDVLELQGHGGPVVMDLLLQAALQLGARPARPGEFTERAFINDKIDLLQAEAVADLIDAVSVEAVRSAQRSLQGEFSRHIKVLVERIASLRVAVEGALDFPEEDIEILANVEAAKRLEDICSELDAVFASASQGSLMREGLSLVIIGRPNVGKSSLLNRLAGRDSAIVTDVPGTTRDLLRERVNIDGLPVTITDTAGLRPSTDRVEMEGINRAREAAAQADRVILVVDDNEGLGPADHALRQEFGGDRSLLLVHNKIDLSGAPADRRQENGETRVWLSALEGSGMDLLREEIKHSAGYLSGNEGNFMGRRRHLDALGRAQQALATANEQLVSAAGIELVATELAKAQRCLGEITGEFTAEDLLGRIFAEFCIGK